MAKLYNLARMTTSTTGTGTMTLIAADVGYLTFADAGAANGDVVTYAIRDGSNAEIGRGTYSSTGPTLSRDTVLKSTNSGAKINLSGNALVFITPAAEDLPTHLAQDTLVGRVSSGSGSPEALSKSQVGTLLANSAFTMLGINATADSTNRLAVSSAATLFNHEGGNCTVRVNKAATLDRARVIFYNNNSWRAETGIYGDDSYCIVTSDNGSNYLSNLVLKYNNTCTLNAGAGSIELLGHGGNPSQWRIGGSALYPMADNAYGLGWSGGRCSSIYAVNGTIQTSDEREKEEQGRLDGFAYQMVKEVRPVLFKWKVGQNDVRAVTDENGQPRVDEKGHILTETVPRPGQRVHAGFYAQDVKAAMDAAGVDFGAWTLDDPNDPNSRQGTRPDQLMAVLWECVRQLMAKVEALEAKAG